MTSTMDSAVLVLAAGLDIAVDDPFKGFAIETADFEVIGRQIAGGHIVARIGDHCGFHFVVSTRYLRSISLPIVVCPLAVGCESGLTRAGCRSPSAA